MPIIVVFVHVDSPLPLYLLFNLYRAKRYLPYIRVTLLYNRRSLLTYFWQDKTFLTFDDEENDANQNYGYPKNFRNNFWFNSVVRFSLISRFQKLNDIPILHIESDVIIARDFPIIEIAKTKTPFGFPVVSQERAIASTLFIRDAKASRRLWNFAIEAIQANKLVSDMEILYKLWHEYPDEVSLLPIAPHHLFKEGNNQMTTCISYGGFFDGNDFGVFLAGTNPWNRRGVSQLHTKIEKNLLQFGKENLIYDGSRKFLSIRSPSSDRQEKLFSLHITNKNPLFFAHFTSAKVLRIWNTCFKNWNKTFHPFVLISMVFKSLKRNSQETLKSYIHRS